MKPLLRMLFVWCCLSLMQGSTRAESQVWQGDICVFGGTSGGVAAAVQAARLGRSVALVEPGHHLGGMTSGGLGATDIGNKAAIGGISREFYQRIGKHYGKPEAWTFEPGVAESVFKEWAKEAGVQVFMDQKLSKTTKSKGRIQEIRTRSGQIFRARIFIDASYEGDLMAAAGVGFHVGREANSVYNETLNGIRAETPKHQFLALDDPWKEKGNPASGLLPLIQSLPAGAPGDGDNSVQAYNFRLVLTRDPANKRPIEPPPGYNPARYELAARYSEALVAAGRKPSLGEWMHIQPMPGGKTDINNNGGFSTDFIGANYDYPKASYEERAKIVREHENYTRGLLHFLATEPRLPSALREEMQSWGLCRDEFTDTGGWPHQLYIREARRMIGAYVMTEFNCRGTRKVEDAIGLAAYTMDSHNCRRLVRNGHVENEGDVQVGGFPPYPISYRAITPKQTECANLLVPVCLSASHIAYGSIRMEPVFMVLGHSAAVAANIAIEKNTPVQQVSITELQARLRSNGQILEWKPSP